MCRWKLQLSVVRKLKNPRIIVSMFYLFIDLTEYYSKLASNTEKTVVTIPESADNDQDSTDDDEDEEFIAA
jgi:hypothetical protein